MRATGVPATTLLRRWNLRGSIVEGGGEGQGQLGGAAVKREINVRQDLVLPGRKADILLFRIK